MHRASGVPVYVDGRKAGTAKIAVTRHEVFDGPINRVELTEFDGTFGEKHLEHLKQCISEKDAELDEVKSKYYRQSLEMDVRVKEVKDLQAKLKRERGNDSYWHEKYLENEAALATVRSAYRRILGERNELSRKNGLLNKECEKLVDDYNRLNDDINRFMDKHSEGAIVINEAVDAWNATVPE